jgi:pilus assembly protein Flp/PilA
MKNACRRILRDQTGATAIEYGLIVALIVIGLIAGLSNMGGGTSGMWTMISGEAANHMAH